MGEGRVRVLELGAGQPGMALRLSTGRDGVGVRLRGAGPEGAGLGGQAVAEGKVGQRL